MSQAQAKPVADRRTEGTLGAQGGPRPKCCTELEALASGREGAWVAWGLADVGRAQLCVPRTAPFCGARGPQSEQPATSPHSGR